MPMRTAITIMAWAATTMGVGLFYAGTLYEQLRYLLPLHETVILLTGFLFGVRYLTRAVVDLVINYIRKRNKAPRKAERAAQSLPGPS